MASKRIMMSVAVMAALGAGALFATAQAAAPAAPAPAAPGGGRGAGRGAGGRGMQAPTNLGSAMTEMNRMLTALKAEATDSAKEEQTLRDLATFERDVAIAKMQTPPVNRATDAQKPTAATDYRTLLTTLQRTALDIEDAVVAQKPDGIKAGLAKFEEIEKQGHTEFKVNP